MNSSLKHANELLRILSTKRSSTRLLQWITSWHSSGWWSNAIKNLTSKWLKWSSGKQQDRNLGKQNLQFKVTCLNYLRLTYLQKNKRLKRSLRKLHPKLKRIFKRLWSWHTALKRKKRKQWSSRLFRSVKCKLKNRRSKLMKKMKWSDEQLKWASKMRPIGKRNSSKRRIFCNSQVRSKEWSSKT